jgi:hypothetical protein
MTKEKIELGWWRRTAGSGGRLGSRRDGTAGDGWPAVVPLGTKKFIGDRSARPEHACGGSLEFTGLAGEPCHCPDAVRQSEI